MSDVQDKLKALLGTSGVMSGAEFRVQAEEVQRRRAAGEFEIGKAVPLRDGGDVGLVSTGVMTNRALTAAETLAEDGIQSAVLHVHTLKPLDDDAVLELAARVPLMVTIEEHTLIGGLGSAVVDLLAETRLGDMPSVIRLGLPDQFAQEYGSQDSMLETLGLQPPAIAEVVSKALSEKS